MPSRFSVSACFGQKTGFVRSSNENRRDQQNVRVKKPFLFPIDKKIDQGSISSNLSSQYKAQICLRTASLQVSQLFFFSWLDCLFALLGSVHVKDARKHVDEIDPWYPLIKHNWNVLLQVNKDVSTCFILGTLICF